ncbi:hypothetical protein C0Q70_17712 [Pomacea canaliculata]|uniref:Uncharacterized protein n=1 Tax=Pomacea canaliculata TaxID=400727 RepID=A0A2T7NL68_POMCA|nr:hypothetical protein C0Q70_17712 [Pomacea canaliculata]
MLEEGFEEVRMKRKAETDGGKEKKKRVGDRREKEKRGHEKRHPEEKEVREKRGREEKKGKEEEKKKETEGAAGTDSDLLQRLVMCGPIHGTK